MLRILLLATVISLGVPNAQTCQAQSELLKRIKAVQDVPIWYRPKRSNAEIRRLLKDLHSPDKKTMQSAFEQLALTRPVPTATDTVIEQTSAVVKKTRDKFATAMAFVIKHAWTDAKKAAETLLIAQRNGGLRYLEHYIVRGNPVEAGGPLIAAAYSGNKQAFQLVGQYWSKTRIPGKRAILIVGPPVAPELLKQLMASDLLAQMEIAGLLGKVGTEKQLPQLEALAEKAAPNLRKKINEAIKEIKLRQSKESPAIKS